MSFNKLCYRPEWTCGRYVAGKHIAVYYNLTEGVSYLFEDISADFIGIILSLGRWGSISVEELASRLNLECEVVSEFAESLSQRGLIAFKEYTDEEVREYRHSFLMRDVCEKMVVESGEELSTAEMDYTDRVGGVTVLMMELTYNCSEKCVHCYNPGATRNDAEIPHRMMSGEMSVEDYRRVIDSFYEQGLCRVCLTGGDPFFKPQVWQIIDYLYQKDIAIEILTNGQKLHDRVGELAKYYPYQVGLSIYSDNAEVHDRITRVKGSWEKTVKTAEALHEHSIPIAIKCCIIQPNLSSYYGVRDIADRFGATMQYEVNMIDSVEGDKCVSKFLRLTPEQYNVVLTDGMIPGSIDKESEGKPFTKSRYANPTCKAGYYSFCVNPVGELKPCCSFPLVFGNVREQPLDEILEGSEELKRWRNTVLSDYHECGSHLYCEYCNLCAANNYSEHGDYTLPAENNCYMAKVRCDLAERLRCGYDPLGGETLEEKLKEFEEKDIDLKRVLSK